MKYIKYIIVALLIIIILIISIILGMSKKQKNVDTEDSYDNGADVVNINTDIKKVDNASLYYTVKNCLDSFYKAINMEIVEGNEDDYVEGGEISYSTLMGVNNIEEKNKIIFDKLNNSFIKDNEITQNNAYQKLVSIVGSNYTIDDMYIIDGENIKNFYVYAENQNNDKLLYNVILDVDNMTYSIKLLQYADYTRLSKDDDVGIEKNSNNVFEYSKTTDEQMSKNYFYDFKNLIVNNSQYAYDKFDDEYSKKRFGSIFEFQEYINNNKNELYNLTIKKYSVNITNEYTEYICQDQYGRNYIFKVTNVMDYTVQLDTYTIPTEKFKTEYDKAESEKKVQMNIDKFIQMVNRHDYKTSYNCIADGFKNNYFDTQDKFENYIKNAFFEYNNFEFENIEQKGNNLYTCTVTLTDLTGNSNDTKKITIIMQLNDNYDFKMSFSV